MPQKIWSPAISYSYRLTIQLGTLNSTLFSFSLVYSGCSCTFSEMLLTSLWFKPCTATHHLHTLSLQIIYFVMNGTKLVLNFDGEIVSMHILKAEKCPEIL